MITISGDFISFAAKTSNYLRSVNTQLNSVNERIVTGNRVNSISDDQGAYFLAKDLNRNVSVLRGAVKNDLENSVGIFQIASSTMDKISDLYDTLTNLAADSASDSPSVSRAELDNQFEEIKTEITNTINGAVYGGVSIMDGTYSTADGGTNLQPLYTADSTKRLNLRVDKIDLSVLNVDTLDISSKANAQSAYTSLTDDSVANSAIGSLQTKSSAMSQRLSVAGMHLDYASVYAANYESAASSLLESDSVLDVARQTALQVRQQAAISVMIQSNISSQFVTSLFPASY